MRRPLTFFILISSLSIGAIPSVFSQDGAAYKEESNPLVPEDLIDDDHFREEMGLNQFTAPSIELIFEQLNELTPLPVKETKPSIQKRMPIDRADLSIEIGLLIAEGFLNVQSGNLDEIEQLATELSTYSKSLGAGEKVSRHAASILEYAKENNIEGLKKELSATQRDVELELIRLRDIDLAHLISLGGWARALSTSSTAVNNKYSEERAKLLYRDDIADYYEFSLDALDPKLAQREDFKQIKATVIEIKNVMTLKEGEKPNITDVKKIHALSDHLIKQLVKRNGK